MKNIKLLVHFVLLLSVCSTSFAAEEGFHSVQTRDDVEVPLWVIEPDNASHIVILIAGGKGRLNIDESGIGKEGNFLVRMRHEFAEMGTVVAVIDKPSDRKKLFRFRKTKKHTKDFKAVMAFLRKRNPNKPLWLVGTSRGTISAANVASRLHGKAAPAGIVLTSSVTRKSKKNRDSLEDIDLESITVPTYIVHHKNDECIVTPYDEAEELMDKLSAVKVKEFKGVSGGDTVSNPCKGKSYHGFLDIEDRVVKLIVDWIKAH